MDADILIGPFRQIITMDHLPHNGALNDEDLIIIEEGGILIKDEVIDAVLNKEEFEKLVQLEDKPFKFLEIKQSLVLTPGLIDSHTHICFAGSRSKEYAMKLAGKSYLEISQQGGGILSTVKATREASLERLTQLTLQRARTQAKCGITTCEVKSGYGLSVQDELKILQAITNASKEKGTPDLLPTCLAAHVKPPEFETHEDYLNEMKDRLLPEIIEKNLSNRIDIFIEEGAFDGEIAKSYLEAAKKMGFDITVHADQFSVGGSKIAAEVGALSADHLEVSGNMELAMMREKNISAIVLPGASLGLGIEFAPARKILDEGLSLVIASDWNPGTAPMGDLLVQTALIGAFEKLSMAETLASITFRAASALNLSDRGILKHGLRADMCAFPCEDFSEIFYRQGSLKPEYVWKKGRLIDS